MKDPFSIQNPRRKRQKCLQIKNGNTKIHGKKSISLLGPEIWNYFPEHIKVEKSFNIFQMLGLGNDV